MSERYIDWTSGDEIRSVDQEIRPHVVLLGAGAAGRPFQMGTAMAVPCH